jgi:transcriptional antiterminator RfaH
MEHWYVLHSKPNAEYQVVGALQGRGIQTYLPEIETSKARPRRKRRPFFPCYLFVKTDFREMGLSQLRWIPGLRRIVAFDDQPMPVSDEVIDLIRDKLEDVNSTGGWPTHTFQPGDAVRITQGPLQGMLAVFEKPTTPAERVQVLLNFLGQASRLWLPSADLEKVPEATQSRTANPARCSRRTRGGGRRIRSSVAEQIRH